MLTSSIVAEASAGRHVHPAGKRVGVVQPGRGAIDLPVGEERGGHRGGGSIFVLAPRPGRARVGAQSSLGSPDRIAGITAMGAQVGGGLRRLGRAVGQQDRAAGVDRGGHRRERIREEQPGGLKDRRRVPELVGNCDCGGELVGALDPLRHITRGAERSVDVGTEGSRPTQDVDGLASGQHPLDLCQDPRIETRGERRAGRDEQRPADLGGEGPPASASEKKSERARTTDEALPGNAAWETAIDVAIASAPKIRDGSGVHGAIATPNGFEPTVMSVRCLVATSIVETVVPPKLATKTVVPSGVIATPNGPEPTGMSVGLRAPVATSIVDTESARSLVTKAVVPSGVIATPTAFALAPMSAGFLVRVATSILDTERLNSLVTKAVVPSGVIATPTGHTPTGMSVGFLVRVATSIVDTELLAKLVTKAVFPSGVIATPAGLKPTGMSAPFLVRVATSIVDTESLA